MDKPLLNDKNEYPDDEVLAKYLGRAKSAWDELAGGASSAFHGLALEWRYYNDGHAWLCKLVYKKKTVCWLSVWNGFFKTTFYFTEKTDKGIKDLGIDRALKDAYFSAKSFGKLKPMTMEVKSKKALTNIFTLIKYKINWKA
jgi:hypothetical protein